MNKKQKNVATTVVQPKITPSPSSAPAPTTEAPSSFTLALPKWGEYAILLAIIGIYFLIRQNFWAAPMERDEGIYTYFGRLVLDGQIPYKDFYEHRLPGIFYMYAFLVAIFGEFEGLAMGFTLMNAATLLFIYYFTRNWFNNRPIAFIAMISAAVLGLAPSVMGFTRQSEHIVAFWAMGGLFFLLQAFQKNSNKYLILSGVFMCLSMLTKPNGVFFIILGGLWTLLYYFFDKGEKWSDTLATNNEENTSKVEDTASAYNKNQSIKRTLIKTSIYSAAVFGTFGILCLVMLAQGVLGEMFYWSVTHSAGYAAAIPMAEGFKLYFTMVWKQVYEHHYMFWYGAGLGLILNFFIQAQGARTFKILGLPVLFICSFLTIVPAFTFYAHYWIMLMPAVAICFAAAFYGIYTLGNKSNNILAIGLGAFAVLLFVHFNSINNDKTLGLNYYTNPKLSAIMLKSYGNNPFNEAYEVGKYLKPLMQKGDELLLIGSEPELYIYTGANAPTRHAYFSYLMRDSTETNTMPWQAEFKADVEEKKPRFIVLFNHQISILATPVSSLGMINEMITQYLPQHYHIIGGVDFVGTTQPKYIFNAQEAANYRFVGQQNGQQIYNIVIFQRKE